MKSMLRQWTPSTGTGARRADAFARAPVLLALACLWAGLVYGERWNFYSYGEEVGLRCPGMLFSATDSRHRLWASSECALYQMNGDRFEEVPFANGTRPMMIHVFHESPDGQVWFAGSDGYFTYRNGQLSVPTGLTRLARRRSPMPYASDETYLYISNAGGLFRYRLDGSQPAERLDAKPGSGILRTRDGSLWWGCDDHLCVWRDGVNHQLTKESGTDGEIWMSLAEDRAGQIWLRSENKVLMRPQAGSPFRPVPGAQGRLSGEDPKLLAVSTGEVMIPYLGGLVACSGAGCRAFDTRHGLAHAEVLQVSEDHEGSLWLAYGGQGLKRWLGRKRWSGFSELDGLDNTIIWRVLRDARGTLWVGTNQGLYSADGPASDMHFRKSSLVPTAAVYGLASARDGSVWIATWQNRAPELVQYNPRTMTKTIHPVEGASMPFHVRTIRTDHSGTLWVATNRGLFFRAKDARRFEQYAPLAAEHVNSVAITREGLYAATRKGLYVERAGFRRMVTTADGLLDGNLRDVTADGPDGVMVSYHAALGMANIGFAGSAVHIANRSLKDGLPSKVIYLHFRDRKGTLWLGTERGVAKWEDGRWSGADTGDGLIWNDCDSGAYLVEDDGTVWIGTSNGLSRFDAQGDFSHGTPATNLLAVSRNGMEVRGRDFSPGTESITFRFAIDSFLNPNGLFRYRIDPNQPWADTRGHEVRLANLLPAEYRFEVQGEVSPGSWSTPAAYPFQVRPSWQRTIWFQLGCASTLILLGWTMWIRREKRTRAHRVELEQAVADRTRELEEATVRAERASRYKGEFLANMSHEVRTPLNGVIGLTELALELSDKPELREHLRVANLSAKGLLALLNDILDLSKIESGKLQIAPVAFEVRTLIEGVRAMLANAAAAKGIQIEIQVDEAVPKWVKADDVRLRQIVVNLAGNAVKFTPKGRVGVAIGYSDSRIRISVTDTGIGIPADKLTSIFESFEQADNSTTRKFGGTGLGLSISKHLAELMGGELSVTSTVGEGSTFSFEVPAPAASPPTPAKVEAAKSTETSLRILVAEDNKVNQHLIRSLLERMGHSVTIAANGREALEAVERDTFDLVLMDVQMPEMDGIEAVHRIRAAEADTGKRLPIVALTARAMAGDREMLLAEGMDEYLEKPIRRDRLNAVLDQIARHGSVISPI